MSFPKSSVLLHRGARSDAWAATRSRIREVDEANSLYPQYFSKAKGAWLWDVDGNRYIDFILGYGPVVLGHADERVNAAVTKELEKGCCISPMWSVRQVELTELLLEVIPGAECAYLMRTGSDATAAAVRLARIYTGREKVLKWGYNGWHDWTAPRPAGVPEGTRANTLHFTYNDLASVHRAFEEHPRQIACVIMMPFELELPRSGFLNEVRELAHQHGALFILDEMRSGFRMAVGGAQEYFGLVADLSTFSKAMANGFPISAVVGRADILDGLGQTHMSSTYYANPAEMVAAITTISILRSTDSLVTIWMLSELFCEGMKALIKKHGAPAEMRGFAISPLLEFHDSDHGPAHQLKVRFYQETVRNGVLFHPNHQWYLSAAHTFEDIEGALKVCDRAFSVAMNSLGGS